MVTHCLCFFHFVRVPCLRTLVFTQSLWFRGRVCELLFSPGAVWHTASIPDAVLCSGVAVRLSGWAQFDCATTAM